MATDPGDRLQSVPVSLEKPVFILFVTALLTSLFFFVHSWYDLTNDGSTYILTARSIATGAGYTYLDMPFHIRPPGFSTLLVPFVAGEGIRFGAVNLMVSLFGVAGVILLYFFMRQRTGWVLALLTASAVWLNPGYQRLCNQVMSDVPGLALLLGCLLLERWAAARESRRREILLGVAIGLATYVRSITLLLVPALILARFIAGGINERPRLGAAAWWVRRVLLAAACAWVVLLPWNIETRVDPPDVPADQTLNYSLQTAMWHEDPGDPTSPRYGIGEVLSRVPPRLMDVAFVLGSRMQHRIPGSPVPGTAARWAYGALALSMLGCLVTVLVRRQAPGEWFAAGVFAVIAVYFIFTDRLALPVYVFALAATVEVLRGLASRVHARAATLAPAVLLVLLIAVDLDPRRDWETIETRHRAFEQLAASVEQVLEPDARLGAGQGFHYGVYLDRPVYNLMHAARRAGRLDAAERIIDKYELNTIVLSPRVRADLPFMPYFEQRYGPGTPAGEAMVWRVRP